MMTEKPGQLSEFSIRYWLSRKLKEILESRSLPVSTADIWLLADCALCMATELNVSVAISICDSYGRQQFFSAMVNTLPVSFQLAPEKAFTAAALRTATRDLQPHIQPGGDFFSLQDRPGFCFIGGGIPWYEQKQLKGALGVSGGSVAEDVSVASGALTLYHCVQDRFATALHDCCPL